MEIKLKLLALTATAALALTGCAGGTASGFFDGACAPTTTNADGNKVTTCSVTEKPVPTATATQTVPGPTETVTVPGPTVTVTETVTASPTQTATTAPVTPPSTPPATTCTPAANPAAIAKLPAADDHREYMHGVEFVNHNGKTLLVYSSNGGSSPNPPAGDWVNDIYSGYVANCNPAQSFAPTTLVSAPNAQEPASAAVNTAGNLAVTAEDAQFNPSTLDQTYGIWDSALGVVKSYGQKLMPPQGGHSGHVAASGDKFGVSFSDGWVDGGGVDGLGTGDDVFFKVIDSAGTAGPIINTAKGTANRDWWPIVAGSDTNFLQVWQRYGTAGTGGGKVMGAIINQAGQIVKPAFDIFTNNKYYYHDVQYIPATGQYLVVGSQNTASNSGVAVLLDKNGTVLSTKTGLPNTVREGQTTVNAGGTQAVYPGGTGAVVLNISGTVITLEKQVAISWNWDYMGTDGFYAEPGRFVFATGSQNGIKFLQVIL